ncbi:MAG: methyltransferase domain-containing protein [Candidatus Marinimicrobia bacterium]|nr:methyltransferase domain-containing protein [Candidatus Neomarinimicrobiota bacterium]MCF7903121.1 methyltransferase domain-containing protein [Candidatus Neomarinimicrobiota bacterium]
MSKHAHRTPVSQHHFWESIYANGKPAWDMGTATPAFQALIETEQLKPCKVCLPGSGLGYDAILFAQNGFDVTSLEFAPTAVRHQQELAGTVGVEFEICECDLFDLPEKHLGAYELVVEYVTMCAVAPEQRDEFSRVMAGLLQPGGKHISLLFPIEDRPDGPPYGLDERASITSLERAGLILESNQEHPATIKPRRGREKLLIFRKPV